MVKLRAWDCSVSGSKGVREVGEVVGGVLGCGKRIGLRKVNI